MAVALVGRSNIATATTGTLTASLTARSGTIPLTAGHLLVAVVNAVSTTSSGTITQSGGSDWTKAGGEGNSTLCRSAVFWKVALGADAAPAFTCTRSGTYQSMQCVVYELSGTDVVAPVITYGAGQATGANVTPLVTGANVPNGNCYALGAHCVYTGSNATDAWTKSASWTADTTDAATARFHHAWDIYPAPPSGSTLSFLGTYTTVGTAQSAMEVVITDPYNANVTGTAAHVTAAGGTGAPSAGTAVTGAGAAVTAAGGVGTAAGGGGPFAIVQVAPTVSAASLTTVTATLGSPTTAGNTLVACVTTNGDTANPAVSSATLGGAADNWQIVLNAAGLTTYGGGIWYDPGCAGGQTSVVVNCGSGSGTRPLIAVTVYEVAGILAADQSHPGAATTGATFSSGATATTTAAAEIFFGVTQDDADTQAVTGAGTWTTQGPTTVGVFHHLAGYQVVSSTQAATFSGTQTSGFWLALVATFSSSGGAANVTGTAAPVTLASPAGALASAGNVTGAAAAVTVASPAGVPLGTTPAAVTGIPAHVTAASPAGASAAAANVTGTAAHVTAAGGTGSAVSAAAVTGVAAAVTVAGPAGTPSAAAATAGVAAPVTVAAPAGTPAGTSPNAAVAGTAAHVTAAGGTGTPASAASVTGAAAAVTAAGGPGTLAGSAAVTGTAAHVTAAGGTGTAAGTAAGTYGFSTYGSGMYPGSVPGTGAAVTAAGGTGTAAGAAAVTGTAAHVTVASPAGVAFGSGGGATAGTAGAVTVAAPAGALATSAAITGAAAAVTAASPAGVPHSAAATAGTAAPVAVAGGQGAAASPAAVTGVAAHVTAASPAGTPASAAAVTGAPAPVLLFAHAGTLAAAATAAGAAALITTLGGGGVPFGALPFTVGALTASATPAATQVPTDEAASALAAVTGPSGGTLATAVAAGTAAAVYAATYGTRYSGPAGGTLTAADTRTGGPG